MFYIVFDFMMAVIMFLFGMWFYKSEGKATKFLSGYNMKSADDVGSHGGYGLLCLFCCLLIDIKENVKFKFAELTIYHFIKVR